MVKVKKEKEGNGDGEERPLERVEKDIPGPAPVAVPPPPTPGARRAAKLVAVGIFIMVTLVALGVFLDALEVVEAGHKGVIINSPWGPSNNEINEGYQWSTAYIWADVRPIEYRTQKVDFVGHDAASDIKGSVQIITNDSVPIFMDFSIIYHVESDRVADLVIENGLDYKERIIMPYARSIVRDVASQYIALDIIGEKRGAVESAISERVTAKLTEKYIIVEGVAMRDIRIPSSLESSIVAKKVAEQNVLTQQYNLQAQQFVANQTIVNAQANATSITIIAHGQANATVVRAVGQAQAIEVVMAALNSSTADNRTKDYLRYLYMQALTDPSSNIRYVIVPTEGGVPVILDMTGEKKSG